MVSLHGVLIQEGMQVMSEGMMGFLETIIWVVVKIMVPFWVPYILGIGIQKRTIILATTHISPKHKQPEQKPPV